MASLDRTGEIGSQNDAGGLANLLDEIKGQLADADRLHADAMRDAQTRLAEIAGRSERARATLPQELTPALARVEAGVSELAERIAVAESNRSTNTAHQTGQEPWDSESAEALMALYEDCHGALGPLHDPGIVLGEPADGPVSSGVPGKAAANRAAAAFAEHRAWLDQRFADVAVRVEHAISTPRPGSPLALLDQRLEQLEQRFGAALDGVASRADVDGLRIVEAHVAELSIQVDAAQKQLARLDDIERHLAILSARSTAAAAGGAHRPDIETLVEVTADRQAKGAEQMARIQQSLEAYMSERRREDSHTAGVLDTMQDALVRLIDRVDAVDPAGHQGALMAMPSLVPDSRPAVAETPPVGPHPRYEPGGAAAAPGAIDLAVVARPAAVPQRTGETPDSGAPVPVSEQLRKDLNAIATRARVRSQSDARADAGDETGQRPRTKARPLPPAAATPQGRALMAVFLFGMSMAGVGFFGWRIHTDGGIAGLAGKFDGKLLPAPSKLESGPARIAPGSAALAEPAPGQPGDTADTDEARDAATRADADRRMLLQPTVAVMRGATSLGISVQQTQPGGVDSPVAIPVAASAAAADFSAQDTTPGQADMPPALIGPTSLRNAAAKGDPTAEFEVASRFADGKGVKQDYKLAMTWYQRAAARGLGPAQYRLATLYERGLGTRADLARARLWYKRAAEQGNVKAMHNLAVLSAGRESGTPDYATASRWFSEAAERGLADSQFNLGVLYENGLGVGRDQEQAYKWFALAARAGDKESAKRRDALAASLEQASFASAEQLVAGWQRRPTEAAANDPRAAGEAWAARAAEPAVRVSAPPQQPQQQTAGAAAPRPRVTVAPAN